MPRMHTSPYAFFFAEKDLRRIRVPGSLFRRWKAYPTAREVQEWIETFYHLWKGDAAAEGTEVAVPRNLFQVLQHLVVEERPLLPEGYDPAREPLPPERYLRWLTALLVLGLLMDGHLWVPPDLPPVGGVYYRTPSGFALVMHTPQDLPHAGLYLLLAAGRAEKLWDLEEQRIPVPDRYRLQDMEGVLPLLRGMETIPTEASPLDRLTRLWFQSKGESPREEDLVEWRERWRRTAERAGLRLVTRQDEERFVRSVMRLAHVGDALRYRPTRNAIPDRSRDMAPYLKRHLHGHDAGSGKGPGAPARVRRARRVKVVRQPASGRPG